MTKSKYCNFFSRYLVFAASLYDEGRPGTLPVTIGEVSGEVSSEVDGEVLIVKLDVSKLNDLLDFCMKPRSRVDMQDFCDIRSQDYFRKNDFIVN